MTARPRPEFSGSVTSPGNFPPLNATLAISAVVFCPHLPFPSKCGCSTAAMSVGHNRLTAAPFSGECALGPWEPPCPEMFGRLFYPRGAAPQPMASRCGVQKPLPSAVLYDLLTTQTPTVLQLPLGIQQLSSNTLYLELVSTGVPHLKGSVPQDSPCFTGQSQSGVPRPHILRPN